MPTQPADETLAFNLPVADGESPSDGDELVGSLLGQYHIRAVLGSGTMGRVYEAEHEGLGRTSALKVLSPQLTEQEPRLLARFQAEARAVAALVHPHIVTVHNLGSDRGYHFIEMELVPGGHSLKEELVKHGAFEPTDATHLVRQVALGLSEAHDAGLVHRDVKPSNVLLTPDGRAKLADFGLVRRLDGREAAGAELAGTPTFMAPELFRGVSANPRTDLYAVGVMLYYLITARLPYTSDRIDKIVRMHRRSPVPDVRTLVPDVPEELSVLLSRLMAKDPAQRPQSATQLADELKVILSHMHDLESLLDEAVEGLHAVVQPGGRDRYRVILPVNADRIHEVYVELRRVRPHEKEIAVYSLCGAADPRHYEFALRFNGQYPPGGLSIQEVNGVSMFVMARTLHPGRATAAELRVLLREVARLGDLVEQRVVELDLF